ASLLPAAPPLLALAAFVVIGARALPAPTGAPPWPMGRVLRVTGGAASVGAIAWCVALLPAQTAALSLVVVGVGLLLGWWRPWSTTAMHPVSEVSHEAKAAVALLVVGGGFALMASPLAFAVAAAESAAWGAGKLAVDGSGS